MEFKKKPQKTKKGVKRAKIGRKTANKRMK